MDLTTIFEMMLAVASVSVEDILEGRNPLHVLHFSSLLIVMPAAAFCATIPTHKKIIRAAYEELKVVFKRSGINLPEHVAQLIEFAIITRGGGFLTLESGMNEIEDRFLKNTMMTLVDGRSFEEIHESTEIQTEQLEEHYKECTEY